ncbi:MAG: hypothetical protein ACR2HR_10325 [Euzebya sp.]
MGSISISSHAGTAHVGLSAGPHSATSTGFSDPDYALDQAGTIYNVERPAVHVGQVCLSGTTCNASPNFPAGDRRLGYFFTVNFDANDRIFIGASAGVAPLLDAPLELEPTRCLFGTAGTPLCDL